MPHLVLVHGAFHGPSLLRSDPAPAPRARIDCSTPSSLLIVPRRPTPPPYTARPRSPRRARRPARQPFSGAVVDHRRRTSPRRAPRAAHRARPRFGEFPERRAVEIDEAFLAALRPSAEQCARGRSRRRPPPSSTPTPIPARGAWPQRRLPRRYRLAGERDSGRQAAWRIRPTDYVVCTDDPIVLPLSQRALAARTGARVREPSGATAPFLARAEALAALLARLVGCEAVERRPTSRLFAEVDPCRDLRPRPHPVALLCLASAGRLGCAAGLGRRSRSGALEPRRRVEARLARTRRAVPRIHGLAVGADGLVYVGSVMGPGDLPRRSESGRTELFIPRPKAWPTTSSSRRRNALLHRLHARHAERTHPDGAIHVLARGLPA